jgi:hypothetical protein
MNAEDYDYVDDLTDEEVKGLSAYVMMMWILGSSEEREARVILTNDQVNQYIFTLAKHPRLLLKLLVSSNGLGDCRYKFTKTEGVSGQSDAQLVAKHYNVTEKDAKDYLKVIPKKDLETLKKQYKEWS